MKVKFKNLEMEDLQEVLENIDENNYHDFSSLKKSFKNICGKISGDLFDEICNYLYSEFAIESDADITENIDIDNFYDFLISLNEEDF